MTEIEIKRGYEVLPDNNVRFGIRVINNSESAISDVEVIMDYSKSLFDLEGSKIQELGTIPPDVPQTAKFVLKPRGCIHKAEIGATVNYRDHLWKKHKPEMRPKEIHCVCPFLQEKSITRAEFLTLSDSGHFEERGVNFEGITVDKVVDFLFHTCKNRLYKVDEFPLENGAILYLAGDALGEKAYYLLTAVVKEYDGVTQVLLRANSDKRHGLNGFLNEILDNLRHLVLSAEAREIGVIRKEQVINIIDSVVQKTTFAGGEGAASVNIRDSVVHRTEIKEDAEENKREAEERLLREQEARAAKDRGSSQKKIMAVVLVLGVLLVGYWAFAPGSTEVPELIETPTLGEEQTPETAQVVSRTPALTPAADQEETITNSIGMEFVLIPAGEFDMGSPEEGDWRGNAGPVHHVTIEKAFYMGRYEVTQKEWREVMGDNPSYFKGDDLPVESVSWNDVQEFIRKLNEKEGTDKYRLPSEAEWEYACRAGTTTRYSFGDSESKLGDYAWYYENSGNKTHPVGKKNPNPWGLYDMHGNAWEWTQDRGHSGYNGAPTDGSAWESGDGYTRILRGGSWFNYAYVCRSDSREDSGPDSGSNRIGFRLLEET